MGVVQQKDCRLELYSEYQRPEMGLTVDHPSETAQKYLQEHVKTLQEEELPIGSHLRSRRVLEGLRGHKQSRKDLAESFDKFYGEKRNALKEELRPETCSGVMGSQYNRHQKPGAGLGWTEPRKENVIGCMDIRRRLPGYIGGVKIRDSMFADN